MAYVTYPLTGSGDATVKIPTDLVVDEHYQYIKLADGTPGSTVVIQAKATTPGSTDAGMVTRNIPSTALSQLVDVNNPTTAVNVANTVGVIVGNPTTAVTVSNPTTAVNVANQPTVDLSSVGSTRLVGRVDVNNPSTAVTVTSGVVLAAGSSANTIGAVAQGAGSTSVAPWYVITSGGAAGATAVDANLTSAGSTRLVGQVTVANPTTSVSPAAGSSANMLGQVAQGAGSTSVAPWYVITSGGAAGATAVDANLTSAGSTRQIGTVNQGTPGGSSADAWWVRSVTTAAAAGGSTTVDSNNTSAGSTRVIGLTDGIPFSSGSITRSTLNSSAEGQIFAANASRKYAAITNLATAVTLYIGLSTAAVTTLGANAHILVAPLATFTMGGLVGDMPNYTGPIRGRINSTTVVGPVIGVEFT